MMCDVYKRKNDDCYNGELSDGMISVKSTYVPMHPPFYCPSRFPQAYVDVPLPCYLPSFNSIDDSGSNGTIGMKGTASYTELESLFGEPTMPSWEEFVAGLDAQAPTMPSWEEFVSDFEERSYRDIELEAMKISIEPWEGSRSDLETNVKDLAENKTELKTKADEMAAMAESLSDLEFDFEVNVKDLEESKTELETKPKEMASMTMPSIASSHLEDAGLEGSKRSWSEEEELLIEDWQQIDAFKEPHEIFQSNNDESPSAIKQGGSCSGRFGRCANLVVQGGRCLKCSRRYTCGHDNCANYPVKGGLCIRHGAKMPTCSHKGCINNAKKGGLCLRHGAKLKTCVHEGCTNIARRKGGVCWSHNATDDFFQVEQLNFSV